MNQLDKQYQDLLFELIACGVVKETRNGKTVSVFGRQIRHKMKEGFPLLTTKKMYWKGIVTELLWFLRGDTNIKFLVDNDCHIWDGDAYKAYVKKVMEGLKNWDVSPPTSAFPDHKEVFINRIKTDTEFAKKWGDLGPVYGKQWRGWEQNIVAPWGGLAINHIDQIQNLIRDLKTNPDSRRLMVSAWNVGELDSMTLPPCHYGFQVYTRELSYAEKKEYAHTYFNDGTLHDLEDFEKFNIPNRAISLMWNQRSVDVPLGLPFNIASYGLLLEIIAKMTNMIPDELIGNLGDCHIYQNQLDGCRQQITREPYALPKLSINDTYWVTFDDAHEYTLDTEILSMLIEDFQIEAYESHPAIKFPLSN